MRPVEADKPLIWITGAAGFFGSHAACEFYRRGWRVVGIARHAMLPAMAGIFVDWVDGGITKEPLKALLERQGQPHAVVHAAGGSLVSAAIKNPVKDFADSVTTTATLLEVLRAGAPQAVFVLTSSAAVYGLSATELLHEEQPAAPISAYGRHKLMAEQLCEQARADHGQRTVAIRYFSLYGPGLRKQIIWDLNNRIAAGEKRIVLSGTGDETRDFLFIDDAVELLFTVISQTTKVPAVLNGGRGLPVTMRALAEAIMRRWNVEAEITFNGSPRAGDPIRLVAGIDRLNLLGFSPQIDLAEGLSQYRLPALAGRADL